MVIFGVLGAVLFLALVFGPQAWVKATMARHAADRPDYPGTGGELARHLLDQAGLGHVTVERIAAGDHYSAKDKAVRLSAAHFDGRSVTAVAVAAHEVGHAIQHADGYRPLMLRQSLVEKAIRVQQVGSVLMMATPVMFAFLRSPVAIVAELGIGLVLLASTAAVHAVTLPTEFNASFARAMPLLERHIPQDDLPAARQVLKAAALTYVASALVTLLDVSRWLRILRV